MWSSYHNRGLGYAEPCPSCNAMISDPAEHAKYCKGRIRDSMKCPDCNLMITVDGSHKCSAMYQRIRKERTEAYKQRAKERRESGIVSRVKMLKPKEPMSFMEPAIDSYGEMWHEVEIEKNPWKCRECGRIWQTKHEAEDCAPRGHPNSYTRLYGVRYVENGVPRGNLHEIQFKILRKEEPEPLENMEKFEPQKSSRYIWWTPTLQVETLQVERSVKQNE